VALLARRLAITGSVKVSHTPELLGTGRRTTTYFYVSRGTGASATSPIRSVAVSGFDGHVIFHNNATDFLAAPGKPIAAPAAVSKARLFLERMGWPGSSMPLLSVSTLGGGGRGPGTQRIEQVNLGWPGAPSSDRPAATLWVAADGSITEALVLPREARSGKVLLRPVQSAWGNVQSGKAPIGVQIITGNLKTPGTATLSATSLEYVLDATPSGRMYLVPSYRFTGTAHVHGAPGSHQWIALVPAVK
jgi:hypothetical protein